MSTIKPMFGPLVLEICGIFKKQDIVFPLKYHKRVSCYLIIIYSLVLVYSQFKYKGTVLKLIYFVQSYHDFCVYKVKKLIFKVRFDDKRSSESLTLEMMLMSA